MSRWWQCLSLNFARLKNEWNEPKDWFYTEKKWFGLDGMTIM